MTKKTKHPQFSIRAAKRDWENFQKISDKEMKIYPVLFRDMIDAYVSLKASQAAPVAPRQAAKRPARVADTTQKKGA